MKLPNALQRIVHATRYRLDRSINRAIDRYTLPAEQGREPSSYRDRPESFLAQSDILSNPSALLPGVLPDPDQDYIKKVLTGAQYKDLPVTAWVEWSIRLARSALLDHALGNFGRAAMLTEAMLGDDRIQSAFDGRVKGLTKAEPIFIPSNADGSKIVCEDLKENWDEIFPEEVVEQMMQWAVFEGFCLMEIIWEPWQNQNKWIPRLRPWHPFYMYYRTDIRRYIAITEGGSIEIEEGDPKWLLYCPRDQYRGWIHGRVRSCAIPWLVRQFALRDLARFSEVHGLPMRLAKYPAQAPTEDKARFVAGIRNLGAETTVGLPIQAGPDTAAWGVELIEAKDSSWEAFLALRDACNSAITLSIRGTNLTSEVGTGNSGNRAAAEVHQDEEEDYTFTDRRKVMRALRRQLLTWYTIFNYGRTDLTPTSKSAFVHPEDENAKDKFEGMEAACKVVVAARNAGAPIDAKQIYARADMPLIEGREDEANDESLMVQPEAPGMGGDPGQPGKQTGGFGKPPATKAVTPRSVVFKAGDWDESKHKRADDGKFGSGTGDKSDEKESDSKSDSMSPEERKDHHEELNAEKEEKISELEKTHLEVAEEQREKVERAENELEEHKAIDPLETFEPTANLVQDEIDYEDFDTSIAEKKAEIDDADDEDREFYTKELNEILDKKAELEQKLLSAQAADAQTTVRLLKEHADELSRLEGVHEEARRDAANAIKEARKQDQAAREAIESHYSELIERSKKEGRHEIAKERLASAADERDVYKEEHEQRENDRAQEAQKWESGFSSYKSEYEAAKADAPKRVEELNSELKSLKSEEKKLEKEVLSWVKEGRVTHEEVHAIGNKKYLLAHINSTQETIDYIKNARDRGIDHDPVFGGSIEDGIKKREEHLNELKGKFREIEGHIESLKDKVDFDDYSKIQRAHDLGGPDSGLISETMGALKEQKALIKNATKFDALMGKVESAWAELSSSDKHDESKWEKFHELVSKVDEKLPGNFQELFQHVPNSSTFEDFEKSQKRMSRLDRKVRFHERDVERTKPKSE